MSDSSDCRKERPTAPPVRDHMQVGIAQPASAALLKPGECDPIFLAGIVEKAMNYGESDPETALMHARKSAEAICSSVFAREIGDPGQNRLDKLIEVLSQKEAVPERIKVPLKVLQQYGNYGAHFQTEQHPISRAYISPALGALVLLSDWYFLEYLGVPIPEGVANANNNFEPNWSPVASPGTQQEGAATLAAELKLPFALHAFQWEGVNFLAGRKAALLADEMGLGKTVQTIVALRLLHSQSGLGRTIVVVPSPLAHNWEREFRTWAPDLVVRRVSGTSSDRMATYQLPVKVLIATYEQVRADAMLMDPDIIFDIVILDEGQRIKNRQAMSSLACRLLQHRRAWVLTGTPLENSVEDVVSLFIFLAPGLLDSGMTRPELHRRIKPYFLRRRKREVLGELPPIIEQEIVLELEGRQQEAYSELWLDRKEKAAAGGLPVSDTTLLSMITALKQLCNYEGTSGESIKLEAFKLVLEKAVGPGDKIILFSQYVETLKFIQRKLADFPCLMYTGEQAPEIRDEVLSKFRSEVGPQLLLMSLRAGGVGLNIQEASCVVLFDRWWNPAVESQAVQRAHRFGRDRPLHVIRFLVANSIEERIMEVLRGKGEIFHRYVEDAENADVKAFTRSEMRKMLGLTIGDTEPKNDL
jgi:SNF2 family DNA or RNA helicase